MAVVENCANKRDEFQETISQVVSEQAAFATYTEKEVTISEIIHLASQSLIISFGNVACNFSPLSDDPEEDEMKPFVFAMDVLTKGISVQLAEHLVPITCEVEGLTEKDIGVYESPNGTLYVEDDSSEKSKIPGKDTGKGRRTEDEEWELQIKKELEKKRLAASGNVKSVSAEDKKLIQAQDDLRSKIAVLFEVKYHRLLTSIESLSSSDIEIGNSCLPTLSPSVLQLSILNCAAMDVSVIKEKVFKTLTSLAACVYEIEEEYAPMMATALIMSCKNPENAKTNDLNKTSDLTSFQLFPLPTPCEPAANTVFEMDEFQEELSGPSFAFLLPVIRAVLLGPRTVPGCEGVLRVLERHTVLLAGDDVDKNVKPLRAEMVTSVLELLKYDRAKAFADPDPYETLVACYSTDDNNPSGPALSTAELAPLLDERGALGEKNCRVASMIALGSIATSHKKIVKNNPLIENRIWLNCFEENESIRSEARKTWSIVNGQDETDETLLPPSAMYAIPLLPLLHNTDSSIATAAAKAYAFGMKAHPKTVNRNLKKLCNSYINSSPQPESGEEKSAGSLGTAMPTKKATFPTPTPPKKKPLVSTGLKKKTVKKSALQVAGIGQPKKKVSKKSKAMTSAMLKPKQERKLDQTALEDQFKTGPKKTPAEKDTAEKVSVRSGVLRVLAAIPAAKLEIDNDTLKVLTTFLMAYGIADGNEGIKNTSRNALRDIIVAYAASDDAIAFLLSHLDDILKNGVANSSSLQDLPKTKISETVDASNRRKEGAVVALGSVALHLKGPQNAMKIDNSVDMLISSLKTPNEDVQASVADALTKLMKKGNTQSRIEDILDKLIADCLEGESPETRHGAAYGIAAAVKGSGIATLKKFGIVTRLEEACADGSSNNKEGSLFGIQLLCTRLGLLFEPYVIVLLPSLLKAFGDGSDSVRKAASKAVGVIMSKLSAHGVKLVLPAVLTAFNDSSWRTKQASIDMLGSMSHLAPKQLASALPKVVPKLTEAFTDTHPKVKSSAQGALDEISSVIRNPEIREISPKLLKALTDPASKTLSALEALIETEFLHAIDAPSLALIVPILHRGLRDRAATTKRYGALITGNICTMINDPRDFIPYIPTLMPDLKGSLLDPIPDVRSIVAKALGSLTRGLGEDALPDLRPWLLEHLRLEALSSAERSGAAQGLTEVLIASGNALVESLMMDDILPLSNHPSHSTREGVLWVLCYLPPAMGQGFTVMLDDSLPTLISGLSDDNEQVREVAIKAGRVLIKSHGKVHFDKILPILQNGMTDEDYRIRLSSLMLLGDLLSMIGGTTVLRTDGDTQDDIRRAERAQAQITQVLGIRTRNRVLSDVYLARSDNASAVRHAAVQVWKTVVSVTARTLRQILQVLVSRVVKDLASGDVEKTEMAGKCLGDIVRKLGDSVLPEVIPVLSSSLYEGDHNTRRGVCVGLSEVIGSSTKDQIIRFLDIIVNVVQDAICDDNEGVREMAASSFQNLYNLVGSMAMDEVVPSLMVALENEDDEDRSYRALNGLTGILNIRSKELLPYIIPRLIQQPMTISHAKAISSIATVTSETLHMHFNSIIPALITDLASGTSDDKTQIQAVRDCARSVFEHADEAGVNRLLSEVSKNCTSDKAELRKESCWMLGVVVEARKELKDFYDLNSTIIRDLVHRFNDDNKTVVKTANKAFAALSKYVPAEVLVEDIEYMRNIIASMVSDARRRKGGVGDGEFLLPGFNIPKGLEPLLPIYQRGILYGTPSIREASAAGLGEVINLTANKFLAGPLIIKMTGPLLRIVGDRNPANVKIAILKTLGLILVKGGPALRAFVPQFQTTFVKALSDPSRQVRLEAIAALGLLMPLSTRVDPLIKELVAGSLGKGNVAGDDGVGIVAVQTATLEALAIVLQKGGKKSKLPDSIPSAVEASTTLIRHSDDSVREAAAKVTGAACNILGPERTEETIRHHILDFDDESADIRQGKACAIRRVFSADVAKKLDGSTTSEMLKVAIDYMKDEKLSVKESGIVAVGAVVGSSEDNEASLRSVEKYLLSLMVGDLKQRLETHQSIARCLCLCLELSQVDSRISLFGLPLLKACIKLAMSGNQRVQFAYNDVLWLALSVSEGQAGLDEFASKAMFEDARQMKSLYSKVLLKIEKITILED
jgi:HEAT repeat protein